MLPGAWSAAGVSSSRASGPAPPSSECVAITYNEEEDKKRERKKKTTISMGKEGDGWLTLRRCPPYCCLNGMAAESRHTFVTPSHNPTNVYLPY